MWQCGPNHCKSLLWCLLHAGPLSFLRTDKDRSSGCTQKQRDNQYLHCARTPMWQSHREWTVMDAENPFHPDKPRNGNLHVFENRHD